MAYERLKIPSQRDGWVMRYEPATMGTGLRAHAHRELEINLVERGSGSYLIQGGKYALRKGTLLWLFPGQPHLLVDATEDFSMWVVVFRPRLVSGMTDQATEAAPILRSKDPGRVYALDLDSRCSAAVSSLLENLAAVPAGEHAWFNSGLGFLLRTAWETGSQARELPSVARIHPAVERAMHLLRDDASERLLVDVAAAAGISYSRLCTLFTAQAGESMGAFRSRMRVQRLIELAARHPSRKLLDLALEAGFGSYAQCHRMVLRHTGRSPAALR